ncbi:hypothetical protein SDC9_96221 [bioreactor metagenome]|uniref:CAAX prenyl protease 2/Lysostaphin resistance protein A-like domain-containing protein n=1 Tax=bioreactor metagenome TaxID=1076179 RepID=A0A645AB21_9ZZZZ|nr:CPBP family intramembrane glutamic endopeptidase [Erysipelotrichaceae bacterium]
MEKSGFFMGRPAGIFSSCMALLIVQEAIGKAANLLADQLDYQTIDPSNAFAWQSIHHIVLLISGLILVWIFRRLLKDNFGFQLGDRKTGMRFFYIFTAVIAVSALFLHLGGYFTNQPVTYDFALNQRNILGTLGFQLLLSGPAEEILYRALPITILLHVLGKSTKLSENITLEVVFAALLFVAAHISWSISPLQIQANIPQLLYALAIGTVQGMAYQKSRSIIYPIMMHSISNFLMVGTGYLFTFLF